ncbi:RsiV family protein [Paenibacillus allorhizosphaerae]|uniref:Anti-sigma-V factor RsiV n=1 Tax=Paenibacillus allorhizosphaerae TaxID=2849866 RepID=A0ABN7TAR5_9BACL|nr:RsiV family protein [Paenibacillus allorhizosphaerae]CAG7616953.1 Anti-sigma-V factor RsiV [Paenibacillus allorhizosphaerae]
MIGINVSTSAAQAFSAIPGVGPFIKVLTIRQYIVKDDHHHADIKVPGISNLNDKALELGLNEKYLAEGKALYDQFQKDMGSAVNGHFGVDAGYIVKTDTDDIFAIARYVVTSAGSSSEERKYDTIDKKNQILLTLPLLFKDDRYIEVISDNIKKKMKDQMKADPVKTYDGKVPVETFKNIRADQNFFINADGHLVISFNKYEVAPGYMGVQEFIIPTEVIADLLLSRNYVK